MNAVSWPSTLSAARWSSWRHFVRWTLGNLEMDNWSAITGSRDGSCWRQIYPKQKQNLLLQHCLSTCFIDRKSCNDCNRFLTPNKHFSTVSRSQQCKAIVKHLTHKSKVYCIFNRVRVVIVGMYNITVASKANQCGFHIILSIPFKVLMHLSTKRTAVIK